MIRRIRGILIVGAFLVVCFILQCSLVPFIAFAGIKPNLPIIACTVWAFLLGEKAGMFAGLFTGLLSDLFFGQVIGLGGLVCTLLGYVCGKLKRLLYVDSVSFPVLLVFGGDFFYTLVYYVFVFLGRRQLSFQEFLLRYSLPEALYSALAAAVVYPLANLLYLRFVYVRPEGPQNPGQDSSFGW